MCSACQFIDWDTWMNVAAVVVAYKEDQEFAMVRMKNQQAGTLTFPQGFRELGETITETAQREFLEETGHHAINLKLFDIYTSDTKRLIWIIYTATLGKGTFRENPETSELLLYSKTNPEPPRVYRRQNPVRGWSHGKEKQQVFPGSTGAGCTVGVRFSE
jgi:ADP-ribose pyrophosphatase YjhB (NUDIX family)